MKISFATTILAIVAVEASGQRLKGGESPIKKGNIRRLQTGEEEEEGLFAAKKKGSDDAKCNGLYKAYDASGCDYGGRRLTIVDGHSVFDEEEEEATAAEDGVEDAPGRALGKGEASDTACEKLDDHIYENCYYRRRRVFL